MAAERADDNIAQPVRTVVICARKAVKRNVYVLFKEWFIIYIRMMVILYAWSWRGREVRVFTDSDVGGYRSSAPAGAQSTFQDMSSEVDCVRKRAVEAGGM